MGKTEDEKGSYLTAVTYNIRGWMGMDRRRDPDRIVKILQRLHADVIALQEATITENGETWPSLKQLARATGMQVIPGPTLFRKDSDFGNVLLVAHPVGGARNVNLGITGREPRGAIVANLSIDERSVEVIGTHLGLTRIERRKQIDILIKEIDLSPGNVVVLLGDLNEWNPMSKNLGKLKRHFGNPRALPTYPSFFPLFALDRVMARPNQALTDTKTVWNGVTRIASDHLPVRATIRVDLSGEP